MNPQAEKFSTALAEAVRGWAGRINAALDAPTGKAVWINQAAIERVQMTLRCSSPEDRAAFLREIGAGLTQSFLECLEQQGPVMVEGAIMMQVAPAQERTLARGLPDRFMDAARRNGVIP